MATSTLVRPKARNAAAPATPPDAARRPVADDSAASLYQRVAKRIEGLIAAGTIRVGQKVPSVRKLSAQLDVSVSTVLHAYRLLEDRGVIRARPQSGYYVTGQSRPLPPEPAISDPPCESATPTTGNLAMQVMLAARDPNVVQLGAALAGHALMPLRQLNRIAGAIGRNRPSLAGSYDTAPGCEPLRQRVARRSIDAGLALAPSDLIVTLGGAEAITLCLRAVAREGDTIAIESPTYYGILQVIEALGMKAIEIPTCPREGLSVNALRLALDKFADIKAAIISANHNNPLGSRMPDAEKKALAELVNEKRIALIEDDVYGDLGYDDARPSCVKTYDAGGHVMLVSSFSKTLAAGYRVGWCAPGRWYEQVLRLKMFTTIACPSVNALAVAEFLSTGGYDHHLRRIRRAYREQVDRMLDAVGRHFPEGTRATRPSGGFVLWVELPAGTDSMRLMARAAKHRIAIAPGPIFSPTGRYTNYIRLNCGLPWCEQVETAVKTLGKLAREAR
jgi:DNA-binding transcriptional MocR family regulator